MGGILYTALLLLKPAPASCTQSSRMEEIRLVSRALTSDEDERTVTTSSLLCSATAQPLITAFVLVWAPILLLSGFMVRDVAVAEERVNGEVELDENENLIISG